MDIDAQGSHICFWYQYTSHVTALGSVFWVILSGLRRLQDRCEPLSHSLATALRSCRVKTHIKLNMATFVEKVKRASNPSALAVLTVMLFWGQVQNYMMRANLRNGSVTFGPS